MVRSARAAWSPSRAPDGSHRSEEHTSELQSRPHLVCSLLLEKKETSRRFWLTKRDKFDRHTEHAADRAQGSDRPAISDIKFFFFNDTATTEIYTLSLHDALPI